MKKSKYLSSLAFVCALICHFLSQRSSAEVIIEAPLPITHRVEIQPIRVGNTSGAFATTFTNSTFETYIKQQINRIWSQAGVRIDWLPFVDYINNFAYEGTQSPRPQSDLATIVNSASVPPKSGNALVINMFFVKVVPGFAQTSATTTNGLAFVDGNGITMYVGPDLAAIGTNARDGIARTIAHEIGHNLGLPHFAANSQNLMSSPGGTTGRLTAEQRNTIFTNTPNAIDGFDLLQPVPLPNYNQWATTKGVTGGPSGDDDLDGIDNIIEFMFQREPKLFDRLPQVVPSGNGLMWTLPKYQPALNDGLVYRVTTSSDLATWLPAGADAGRSAVIQNNASAIVVQLNSGQTRGFMRLDIEIPGTASAASIRSARSQSVVQVISEPIDIETHR